MYNFSNTRATDVTNAVSEISAEDREKFIAGGTNLINLMRENVACPF